VNASTLGEGTKGVAQYAESQGTPRYMFIFSDRFMGSEETQNEDKSWTIAHEIGHAVYNLSHETDTDNLMHKTDHGTHLMKSQWDKVLLWRLVGN